MAHQHQQQKKGGFVRGSISLLDMIQGDFRDDRPKQALVRFWGDGVVLLKSGPEDRDHVRVVLARGNKEAGMDRFYGLRKNEEEGRESDVLIPLSYLRGDTGMEAETEEQKVLLEELQEKVTEGCDAIAASRAKRAAEESRPDGSATEDMAASSYAGQSQSGGVLTEAESADEADEAEPEQSGWGSRLFGGSKA